MAAELTDEQLDALDSFSLSWGAPRGKDSVRAYGRAVIAALATQGAEPVGFVHYRSTGLGSTVREAVLTPAGLELPNGAPLYTAPPPTAEVEKDAAWMSCESRRPWVVNGLRTRAKDLRANEKKARAAFRKDFMGEPSRYYADACGEAAAVFERRLAALQSDQAQAGKGDGHDQ